MVLKNSGKWQREDFLDLVFFCLCLLMSWASFHKHDIANWIYVTIHTRKYIVATALPDVWNIFQEKNNFFMHDRIDSVGYVMFVERNGFFCGVSAAKPNWRRLFIVDWADAACRWSGQTSTNLRWVRYRRTELKQKSLFQTDEKQVNFSWSYYKRSNESWNGPVSHGLLRNHFPRDSKRLGQNKFLPYLWKKSQMDDGILPKPVWTVRLVRPMIPMSEPVEKLLQKRSQRIIHGGPLFLPPPKKTESQTWGEFLDSVFFLHPMSGTLFFRCNRLDGCISRNRIFTYWLTHSLTHGGL